MAEQKTQELETIVDRIKLKLAETRKFMEKEIRGEEIRTFGSDTD